MIELFNLIYCKNRISLTTLKADLILPNALRRALEQIVTDLPEDLNSSTVSQIILAESAANQMPPEAYAAELYQIVLQYHYEGQMFYKL